MCGGQCFLALLVLSVGVVQSWDVAITKGDQLEFYTNKTKINNVGIGNQQAALTALAYDAVHNMLLFVDKQNENASIFSYNLDTKKYQSLVRKIPSVGIHSIAFDPVESLLLWTDTSARRIYSMSLKPGSNRSQENIWLQMDQEIPTGIAIDSCRGYVYWTNTYAPQATIERARLNGSERVTIVTDVYRPNSLAIDQHSKRLYWVDEGEGINFSVESSNFDGSHKVPLYKGAYHKPNALTVSNDSVYWIDSSQTTVWKLPKTARMDRNPDEYIKLDEKPFSIAASYLIQDQTEGIPECEGLSRLLQNESIINESFTESSAKELVECKPISNEDRCITNVCHNYCFQGNCNITDDGLPFCRCKEGFSGDRCEVNVCTGFCLNNGKCTLNKEHEPVCGCTGDFKGKRCETEEIIATGVDPKDEKTVIISTEKPQFSTDGEFVMPSSCNDGWDAIRDPIIMVLGIVCGLLVLTCVVLFTKILQLKKRPRIKKRIIVNKNVTPLTARPDQCEITIENCCNMNICETPCFEPRSTIRPSLLGAKTGKEEKKNLIANMEFPDDY